MRDGVPTNYTPVLGLTDGEPDPNKIFWGNAAGEAAACPSEDFYGRERPKVNGVTVCDIGAVNCRRDQCGRHCGWTADGCGGMHDCGACGGRPGFPSCLSAFESNKENCDDQMQCHAQATLGLRNCLIGAGLQGLFNGNAVLLGPTGQGYPTQVVFQFNSSRPTGSPGYLTILNGANGTDTLSTSRVVLNSQTVIESNQIHHGVGWSEVTVDLQHGTNTVRIDNLTQVFGALSVLVTDEPLLP